MEIFWPCIKKPQTCGELCKQGILLEVFNFTYIRWNPPDQLIALSICSANSFWSLAPLGSSNTMPQVRPTGSLLGPPCTKFICSCCENPRGGRDEAPVQNANMSDNVTPDCPAANDKNNFIIIMDLSSDYIQLKNLFLSYDSSTVFRSFKAWSVSYPDHF